MGLIQNIETWLNAKKYETAKAEVKALALKVDALYPTPQIGPYIDHPNYDKHIKQSIVNFIDYTKRSMANDKNKIWGVGDSILAQARDYIDDVIDPRLNMALGGMWAHHMLKLVNDMAPVFTVYGFVPKTIVVGTPDGNGMLMHQEIKSVIEQNTILLNRLRCLYPSARIIIYGLPMTIVDYVIQHFGEYDAALFMWMMKDINTVMLPLIKNFVQAYHILPKADWSSDGVHLTPKGYDYFGELIERGKSGTARRLIN